MGLCDQKLERDRVRQTGAFPFAEAKAGTDGFCEGWIGASAERCREAATEGRIRCRGQARPVDRVFHHARRTGGQASYQQTSADTEYRTEATRRITWHFASAPEKRHELAASCGDAGGRKMAGICHG